MPIFSPSIFNPAIFSTVASSYSSQILSYTGSPVITENVTFELDWSPD